MANKMATWEYAANIAGGYIMGYTDNELITKKEAVNIGCDVSGSYSDNQCVSKLSLSKHDPYTTVYHVYKIKIFNGIMPSTSGSSNPTYMLELYADLDDGGKDIGIDSDFSVTIQTNGGSLTYSGYGNMPSITTSKSPIIEVSMNVKIPENFTNETTKTHYYYSYTTQWIGEPI